MAVMMKASSWISFAAFFFISIKGFFSQTSVSPDRVQVFHACVDTTAYIPWPLNVVSRSGHESTVITLVFQHRRSELKHRIATFKGKEKWVHDETFRSRIVVSKEHSGVFLQRVSMDHAGMFTARAKMANGDVWTRKTQLDVHLRPMIKDNRLNISIVDATSNPPRDRKDCIYVRCGKVQFQGYPSAQFIWRNQSHILSRELAEADSYSVYQVCAPFHGQLTCSIGGFSSICTFDHVASINLNLPEPRANSSGVHQASSTRDLILMIVMPVLAIGIPLLILGVWVCVHLLKTYPQLRDQRNNNDMQRDPSKEHNHVFAPCNSVDHGLPPSNSFPHDHLPPPMVEDINETESVATIETSNRLAGLHSPPKQYRDPEQTEKKSSHQVASEDDENDEGNEDDSNEETDDEEEDDDDEEEEEEEEEEGDGDEDDGVDQRRKEKQPLMEDSIHPIVV